MSASEDPASAVDPGMAVIHVMSRFGEAVCAEVKCLDRAWPIRGIDVISRDVILGLLSRQAVVVRDFARSPESWTPHLAPLIHRCMVDTHINLAWIMLDPESRARKFVSYGLGQLKLMIRHRENEILEAGDDPGNDEMLELWKTWQESERYEFLTEVDIANWSGKSVYQMAIDSGNSSYYNLTYLPFSAAAHSQWHHIGMFNLRSCRSEFHEPHRLASMPDLEPDLRSILTASKNFQKSIEMVLDRLGLERTWESAEDVLLSECEKLRTSEIEREE